MTGPSSELRTQLRLAVADFRGREQRRRFDTVVYVGMLTGPHTATQLPAELAVGLDAATCTELVAALLETAPAPADAMWLERNGSATLTDADRVWWVGARRAFESAGRPAPACFVLTRFGWIDVTTGERQTWKRLRLR